MQRVSETKPIGSADKTVAFLGGAARKLLHRCVTTAGLRRLRLITGLTLFTYVTLHLINHALGNISIATMERGLVVQKWIWQSLLGAVALYFALATHLGLGLWAFYERRHFGWTPTEVLQVVLGLSIPPLLTNHVIVTRVSLAFYGTEKNYAQELYSFWVSAPELGVQQAVVLVVAWIHGCIGVYLWLRLKRRFSRAMPVLLCAAAILPLLALLGFFQAGRTVPALARDPAWQKANLAAWQVGTPAQNATLKAYRNWTLLTGTGLVGLVVLARGLRSWRECHGGSICISYPNGRAVRMPRGFSVLEASRAARVPHASICGGRGRCSTCRVRVIAGRVPVPPPSPAEQAVLERVSAGPSVRLACQLRPAGDIAVVPLLPPHRPAVASRGEQSRPGEERFVVAMVIDMRNSVRLAETRMAFDAVFIIDRFIAALDAAVVQAGGRSSNFTGDGLVATFGLACFSRAGLPSSLCSSRAGRTKRRSAQSSARRRNARADPVRCRHSWDTAIVGEIGYAETRMLTTLGDAVNVAARLEVLCKSFGCEAVVSEDVCNLSGFPVAHLPLHETAVRGRAATLLVRTVSCVADLAIPEVSGHDPTSVMRLIPK